MVALGLSRALGDLLRARGKDCTVVGMDLDSILPGWTTGTAPPTAGVYVRFDPDGTAGYVGAGNLRVRLALHDRLVEEGRAAAESGVDLRCAAVPVARLGIERRWTSAWVATETLAEAKDLEALAVARYRLADPAGPPGAGGAWAPRTPRGQWARAQALAEHAIRDCA